MGLVNNANISDEHANMFLGFFNRNANADAEIRHMALLRKSLLKSRPTEHTQFDHKAAPDIVLNCKCATEL